MSAPKRASGKANDRPQAPRPRQVRSSLSLQYATARAGLPSRATLARWLRAALFEDAAVTVRYVGPAEGRALNRAYRGKDYATNVLTFVYGGEGPEGLLQGDIVICAPVVASEARGQRKPLRAHHAHLVVHGLLHLQGYEHERATDARAMERLETDILAALGYPDPYACAAAARPHRQKTRGGRGRALRKTNKAHGRLPQ